MLSERFSVAFAEINSRRTIPISPIDLEKGEQTAHTGEMARLRQLLRRSRIYFAHNDV